MRSGKISKAAIAISGLFLAAAPAAQACQNSNFKGNYSILFAGFVGSAVLSAEALLISDGAGGFSGQISYSRNGFIYRYLPLTGSWSFSTNCTGSGSITNSQIGTVNFDFTLSPNGKTLNGVETDSGTNVTVTGRR